MVQRIDRTIGWLGLALVVLMLGGAGSQAAEEAADAIRPPIDINVAGATELVRLPGIGEVTAKRIVEFREEHGPFRRVEDLLKVKGIGEQSFQKLRRSITVGVPAA